MGLQTNTQPSYWITQACTCIINLTADNLCTSYAYLNNKLSLQPNSCISGDHTTCVIAGNIAHTLVDATSSIQPVRGGSTASGNYSLVAGGIGNTASGNRAFVGSGCSNTASNTGAAVIAGRTNTASGSSAFIGTGTGNNAQATDSIVLGGVNNTASATRSVVVDGCYNTASGLYSFVANGSGNIVSGNYAFIGNGYNNKNSGNCSGILGGSNNTITANASGSFIVGSGLTALSANTLYANNICLPVIGNGALGQNSQGYIFGNAYYLTNVNPPSSCNPYCWSVGTNSIQPVAAYALNNTSPGAYSVILGGCNNYNAANYAIIGGGCNNNIAVFNSGNVILGGTNNALSSYSANATIVGGCNNAIGTNSAYASIAGGACNTASGTYTSIAGGSYNTASQSWAAVNGGASNTASGYSATVAGGDFNTTCGVNSTVAGGHRNSVTGGVSYIGGGYCNNVSGWFSGINGGACNIVANNFANIVGGNANVTNQPNTFILGSNLSANVPNYTYTNNLAIGTNNPNKELTVVGDISATGWYYGKVAQLTIPTATLSTCNGTLSTFDTGATSPNTQAANYIVTLNGASQVPNNDYTILYTQNTPGLSTNKVALTFVPRNGSVVSIISLNTLVYGNLTQTVTNNASASYSNLTNTGTINNYGPITNTTAYNVSGQYIAPVSKVFTGDGSNSTFDTSITGISVTSAANYIVTLNGASQVPGVDYTAAYTQVTTGVSSNKIVTTSPPPLGSTLSVIVNVPTTWATSNINNTNVYNSYSTGVPQSLSSNWQSVYSTVWSTSSTWALNTYVQGATAGLATSTYVQNATANLATTTYVQGATAGLATTTYVQQATSNLATGAGLATTTYVQGATAGLATSTYVQNATGSLLPLTTYQYATGTALTVQDLTVNGTLYTNGGSTQLSSTNLTVSDPLIYFGTGNTTNAYDLGIVAHLSGNLNNGVKAYQHTGLVRQNGQSSPAFWTLFSGLTTEPTGTTISWTDPYFQYDNLNVGYINSDTSSFTSNGNIKAVSFKSKSTMSGYIYGQNTYSGASASTDLALYNDDATAFIDIGVNSNGWVGANYGPPFTIANAKDTYIYSNTGANNLAIGTQNSSGDLLLFTGGTASTNERLRIKSTGNVGIGTSNPGKALTVVGDISATGSIYGNTYFNLITSTTYTIALSDSGTVIASNNNTTGLSATPSSSITYPAGFQVALLQLGSSRLSLSASGSPTINQANGYYKTSKLYSAATLLYTGATTGWVLFGDVSA
jgi:hypothetical protein